MSRATRSIRKLDVGQRFDLALALMRRVRGLALTGRFLVRVAHDLGCRPRHLRRALHGKPASRRVVDRILTIARAA